MHFEMYREQLGLLSVAQGLEGDWRWRLIANNGKIIADSGEGYRNQLDCRQGIALVMSTNTLTPVQAVNEHIRKVANALMNR